MSPPDAPPWTTRHETAGHLGSAIEDLAMAEELARDPGAPCDPEVREAIALAWHHAREAHDRLHERHHLDGATPPKGDDPARPGPVTGVKLQAVANLPGAAAVGRATIYAQSSSPVDPFRQRVEADMAAAAEALRVEVQREMDERAAARTPPRWSLSFRLRCWAGKALRRYVWPAVGLDRRDSLASRAVRRWPRLRARVSSIVHNVVAHPLLEVWPAVGERLHQATEPRGSGDTKVTVAREGMGPERIERARRLAETRAPVTTGHLARGSVQVHQDPVVRAVHQAAAEAEAGASIAEEMWGRLRPPHG